MKLRGAFVIVLGTVTTLVACLALKYNYFEENLCTMSYNRAVYKPIDFDSSHTKVSSKYELFLYREGGKSLKFDSLEDINHLGGTPVLFIPGNAGSYTQGRSFAALAADYPNFDWFLVHFDEDLSAFHGKTLVDEARYINDAIAHILELYQSKTNEEVHASSVIIVAHSMGGIIGRTLVTLENYIPDSVNTIITLSTPHAYPPITFDRDVTQLYDLVGRWWRDKPDAIEIALVSIAGGHNDPLVLPDMTLLNDLGGISAFSYEVPGVGLGIDHLAIVWCAELRQAIIEALNAIADFDSPTRTFPFREKMKVLRSRLKRSGISKYPAQVEAGTEMLYGKPLILNLDGPTDILLPARSSLLSYKVVSNKSVGIAHQTDTEYRNYGVTKETRLMWYSSGPFISFKNDTQRLLLKVDTMSQENVELEVRVDWLTSLANIVLHYRTLAASWPFAIVLIVLMMTINSPSAVNFGQTLCSQLVGKYFFVLGSVMSVAHLALTHKDVRSAVRAIQIPSENANVVSLNKRGYDAHDLLLGINDRNLFWLAPLLLSIAVCAVTLVYTVSCLVIELKLLVHTRLLKSPIYGGVCSKLSKAKGSRSVWLLSSLPLLAALYLIPYQVSTVILAVVHLLSINDRRGIAIGINQLLLWTAVVDAPIVVVWARNLTIEWLWAFASFRNLASTLPLAIQVLYTEPTSSFFIKHNTLRKMTTAVMGYITAYALLYGCLHAFMLHHLTNYLILWLLIANAGS